MSSSSLLSLAVGKAANSSSSVSGGGVGGGATTAAGLGSCCCAAAAAAGGCRCCGTVMLTAGGCCCSVGSTVGVSSGPAEPLLSPSPSASAVTDTVMAECGGGAGLRLLTEASSSLASNQTLNVSRF